VNPHLNDGGVQCAVLSRCTVLWLRVVLPVMHVNALVWEGGDFWFVCS